VHTSMRFIAFATLVSATVSLLAGCAVAPTPLTPTDTKTPTPTAIPTMNPAGDAATNEDYFRYVVTTALAKDGFVTPTKDVANALAAGGFARSGIQFGDSSTAIGMKPDSVMVAALVQHECLIAQYGPSIKELAVSVAPVLTSGGCLIGRTINHL